MKKNLPGLPQCPTTATNIMKQLPYLLLALILLIVACNAKMNQHASPGDSSLEPINLAADTIIRNKLLKLKLSPHTGKTIRQFLQNDTAKLYKTYSWGQEPPGSISSLTLEYAKGLYISITVKKPLKFKQSFFTKAGVDFDKLMDEDIKTLEVNSEHFDYLMSKESN